VILMPVEACVGHPIIDSDRHVIEPTDMWRAYLPPPFAARAPRQEGRDLMFEGQPLFSNVSPVARAIVGGQAATRLDHLLAASHPRGQLAAMDRQGVDVAYLFPTYALYLAYIDGADPALSAAIAQAYNAWLFDYCQLDPQRLKGVGLVARHDPGAMLAELERVLALGFRAVVLRPNPVAGRALNDPAYEPFWASCEAASVTVTFHEGTQARVPTAGADRFATRFAQHACSHPMEQMMAFLALVEAGVLERHPTLRVAFLEAGAGWLPHWLWRLDQLSYPHMREEVATNVTMAPSHYFRRQCWLSFEAGEPGLDAVIASVGLDRLVYGSDYPHPDHGVARIAEPITGNPAAAAEALRRAALYDNPRRLFGA
jgi:predicted TIM-barrel fold metal-dependent hydrolase